MIGCRFTNDIVVHLLSRLVTGSRLGGGPRSRRRTGSGPTLLRDVRYYAQGLYLAPPSTTAHCQNYLFEVPGFHQRRGERLPVGALVVNGGRKPRDRRRAAEVGGWLANFRAE